MQNIYVPVEKISDFKCYVVHDKDTIRAYYNKPAYNSSSGYVDFFINSHYLEKNGTQSWGQSAYYSLPSCLPESSLTNVFYYRTDLSECLIIFLILVLVMFWYPLKLTWFRLFRRFN